MHRCLELAANGLGTVAPNPMVGAVIINKDSIVGEGYHHKYGEAHAEVNAIRSIRDDSLLVNSILYVNLEPCAHSGKTPPCTDLIIEKRIPVVVIGTIDPNSLVAGKGIQKLQDAGVEVVTDVLPNECKKLNRRFFTFHEKKRPYIILKWAQTRDGFIDLPRNTDSPIGVNWISSEQSRLLVHKWRSEEQAIMIGTNTAVFDDPQLTVRGWNGSQPIRIVLDRKLRIPLTARVFNNEALTLCYNTIKTGVAGQTEYVKINSGPDNLIDIFTDMYNRGISSVIVEGGQQVLEYLIDKSLWDEARVFIGMKKFINGLPAPEIPFKPKRKFNIAGDELVIYEPNLKK